MKRPYKYEPMTIKCPDCQGQCRTTNVYFRGDNFVKIDGECDHCGHALFLEKHLMEILSVCLDPFSLENWTPQGRPC